MNPQTMTNVQAYRALGRDAYSLSGGYLNPRKTALWHELKFTTGMLRADVEHGSLGLQTHPRQAAELLKLDTPTRRRRAYDEACTLQNVIGGTMSGCLADAVANLLRLIEAGTEDRELYGEGFARQAREAEADLRRISGNPTAIHVPRGLRH